MDHLQKEIFAEVPRTRGAVSTDLLERVHARLIATLVRLEGEATFCWRNKLDAIHEEKEFRAASQLLDPKGEALWARFDAELVTGSSTRFPWRTYDERIVDRGELV